MNNYKGEKQEITLSKIVSELTNQGYNIVKTDEIDGVRLNPTKMQMYVGEISTIEVIYDGTYYVEVKDKYYKITLENNGIKVNRTASEINVPTTSTNSLNVGTTNLVTAVVNNEYEIQITAGDIEGRETLTITYGDYTATCDIEVKLINGTLSAGTITDWTTTLTLRGGSIRTNISRVEIYNGTSLEHTINYDNSKNKIQETYETGYMEFYKENKYTAKIIDADNREITTNEIKIQNRDTIKDGKDLKNFASAVNGGDSFSGETINLKENIDLSSVCSSTLGNWIPIGTSEKQFKGTFDGQNKIISNMYINNTAEVGKALFGYINNATVKNVVIDSSCTIKAKSSGAAIVVDNTNGNIENCINNAKVEVQTQGAGICYNNKGNIKYCTNSGEIYASIHNGSHSLVAGISGRNEGNISQAYNTGYIHGTYSSQGGISSFNTGKIENCYNTGTIEAGYLANMTSQSKCGGISAYNGTGDTPTGTIENCHNIGTVRCTSGTEKYEGGIVSENKQNATVNNCYSIQTPVAMKTGTSITNTTNKSIDYFALDKDDITSITYLLNSLLEEESWTKVEKYNYPILKWQLENSNIY